jgi:hypothetical protein
MNPVWFHYNRLHVESSLKELSWSTLRNCFVALHVDAHIPSFRETKNCWIRCIYDEFAAACVRFSNVSIEQLPIPMAIEPVDRNAAMHLVFSRMFGDEVFSAVCTPESRLLAQPAPPTLGHIDLNRLWLNNDDQTWHLSRLDESLLSTCLKALHPSRRPTIPRTPSKRSIVRAIIDSFRTRALSLSRYSDLWLIEDLQCYIPCTDIRSSSDANYSRYLVESLILKHEYSDVFAELCMIRLKSTRRQNEYTGSTRGRDRPIALPNTDLDDDSLSHAQTAREHPMRVIESYPTSKHSICDAYRWLIATNSTAILKNIITWNYATSFFAYETVKRRMGYVTESMVAAGTWTAQLEWVQDAGYSIVVESDEAYRRRYEDRVRRPRDKLCMTIQQPHHHLAGRHKMVGRSMLDAYAVSAGFSRPAYHSLMTFLFHSN